MKYLTKQVTVENAMPTVIHFVMGKPNTVKLNALVPVITKTKIENQLFQRIFL